MTSFLIGTAPNSIEEKSAIESFIGKFNSTISEVDSRTKYGKDLSGEYSLISLRNSIRTTATDMVSGLSTYNSMGMIGITSGEVGTSTDEKTNGLQLDKAVFLEALRERPDEVKALLIGDSDLGVTGILQQLESKVESSLDPVNGYFAARDDSMESYLISLDDTIEREQTRLDKREEYLTAKFNRMDQYISQMNSQMSSLNLL